MNILRVDNATMRFGGVTAVNALNLHVDQGEIVAVIGPEPQALYGGWQSVSLITFGVRKL